MDSRSIYLERINNIPAVSDMIKQPRTNALRKYIRVTSSFCKTFVDNTEKLKFLQDMKGNTPIIYAIENNMPDSIINDILEFDDVNYQNKNGETPLLYSIIHKRSKSLVTKILFLCKREYVFCKDISGLTIVDYLFHNMSNPHQWLIQLSITNDCSFNLNNLLTTFEHEYLKILKIKSGDILSTPALKYIQLAHDTTLALRGKSMIIYHTVNSLITKIIAERTESSFTINNYNLLMIFILFVINTYPNDGELLCNISNTFRETFILRRFLEQFIPLNKSLILLPFLKKLTQEEILYSIKLTASLSDKNSLYELFIKKNVEASAVISILNDLSEKIKLNDEFDDIDIKFLKYICGKIQTTDFHSLLNENLSFSQLNESDGKSTDINLYCWETAIWRSSVWYHNIEVESSFLESVSNMKYCDETILTNLLSGNAPITILSIVLSKLHILSANTLVELIKWKNIGDRNNIKLLELAIVKTNNLYKCSPSIQNKHYVSYEIVNTRTYFPSYIFHQLLKINLFDPMCLIDKTKKKTISYRIPVVEILMIIMDNFPNTFNNYSNECYTILTNLLLFGWATLDGFKMFIKHRKLLDESHIYKLFLTFLQAITSLEAHNIIALNLTIDNILKYMYNDLLNKKININECLPYLLEKFELFGELVSKIMDDHFDAINSSSFHNIFIRLCELLPVYDAGKDFPIKYILYQIHKIYTAKKITVAGLLDDTYYESLLHLYRYDITLMINILSDIEPEMMSGNFLNVLRRSTRYYINYARSRYDPSMTNIDFASLYPNSILQSSGLSRRLHEHTIIPVLPLQRRRHITNSARASHQQMIEQALNTPHTISTNPSTGSNTNGTELFPSTGGQWRRQRLQLPSSAWRSGISGSTLHSLPLIDVEQELANRRTNNHTDENENKTNTEEKERESKTTTDYPEYKSDIVSMSSRLMRELIGTSRHTGIPHLTPITRRLTSERGSQMNEDLFDTATDGYMRVQNIQDDRIDPFIPSLSNNTTNLNDFAGDELFYPSRDIALMGYMRHTYIHKKYNSVYEHYNKLLSLLLDIIFIKKDKDVANLFWKLISKIKDPSNNLLLDVLNINKIIFWNTKIFSDEEIKFLCKYDYNLRDTLYQENSGHILIDINADKPFDSVRDYLGITQYMETPWNFSFSQQIGVDAGGLQREYFYLLGKNLLKYFDTVDCYSHISIKNKDDKKLWFDIGKLMGKAFAVDKQMTGIKLHPYILFRITNPKFFRSDIEIETVKYLKELAELDVTAKYTTLYNMNCDSWNSFMKYVDEKDVVDYNNKLSYINNKMEKELDLQYQPALDEFVSGFWLCGDQTKLKYFSVNQLNICIVGNNTYELTGTEKSLEHNLTIPINFKRAFISVLSYFQQKEPDKLIQFIRFWFGTPYINNFSNLPHQPQIDFAVSKDIACKAHTCFNSLEFPMTKQIYESKDDKDIAEWMKKIIENTLENQKLADSGNLHMQLC